MAVERVASTDPNPTDPFRGLYVSDERALALARDGGGGDCDERLASICEVLALDLLDGCVLALCLAPELDPRFGRLFGYLHDDVTRRLASPRLVARLLAAAGWSEGSVLERFARDARLRHVGAIRLVDAEAHVPLGERPVKVAERLAALALGASLDHDGRAGCRRVVPPSGAEIGRSRAVVEVRQLLGAETRLPLIVIGPDAAEVLAAAAQCPLLVAASRVLADSDGPENLRLEAALSGGALCFTVEDLTSESERAELRAAIDRLAERPLLCAPSRGAALALRDTRAMMIEVPLPGLDERLALWSAQAGGGPVEGVAAKFRLSATQIAHAGEVARLRAAAAGRSSPTEADLHRGAREASSRRIEELAIRVEPSNRWEDLILPERALESLRAISAHLRHRDLVLSGWGYERTVGEGQGLKVLFFGDSGTGKTMAGRVLARELGLEMYRIDLAAVVSKFIGETEKNLDRIFEAASGSNAILFFDEADALFGKRSAVSDAHDRYANIEVAYLLQKMEGYAGAVILATNFRGNLDNAFLRRLDFAIEFPFPEVEQRIGIWRRVLPPAAPLAPDVDVAVLAERFKLSGGSIRNSAVAAAFLAADEGAQIEMRHLMRAVAAEYVKLGRLTVGTEFTPLTEDLPVRSAIAARVDAP